MEVSVVYLESVAGKERLHVVCLASTQLSLARHRQEESRDSPHTTVPTLLSLDTQHPSMAICQVRCVLSIKLSRGLTTSFMQNNDGVFI